jgi:hypothetical protein
MNLKKQIAVLVLALTATTSPVWSQDRQALPSRTAQTLQGAWRVTRHAVDCITGQDILSFPAIMTFNQGGTYTGYAVLPGGDPGQGTEYGVWQREAGGHNYSFRTVSYGYTADGEFDGRAKLPAHYSSPPPTASLILPRSRSSTPTAIWSLPRAAGRMERGLNKDHGIWCVLSAPNPFTRAQRFVAGR